MIIARRFRGPPQSANGGYACGVVAGLLSGPAEVTLRSPPPLERELQVERRDGGRMVMSAEGAVVAEAAPAAVEIEVPAPVSFAEAEKASKRYPWFAGHPYPTCFVCGPERSAGDGLRILPGAVEGRQVAAAPWLVDASLCDESGMVREEILWASLDCPSWFGMYCFHAFEGSVLLGRLAARILRRPRGGDRCVALGWFLGREGRKIHAGSAVHSAEGELLALGKATWIALKPERGGDH